ncbi:hypothetical protein [Sphingobacterium sp. SYP-B4668]|nr:hypothetical protein [Sphingobacterium sp. SYP-B4668]
MPSIIYLRVSHPADASSSTGMDVTMLVMPIYRTEISFLLKRQMCFNEK